MIFIYPDYGFISESNGTAQDCLTIRAATELFPVSFFKDTWILVRFCNQLEVPH